jgi:AcrR family transcriptional regulator
VLRKALALADRGGFESLTMRRLAKELGVEAMSLYNHVAGKEDLIDGMIALVFEEIEPPSTDVDWKTAMRRRATSTRAALSRHRWAIGLMEGRSGSGGPAGLRVRDATLGCLRAAGFSPEMTVHANSVQDAYIYGFALQERSMPMESVEEFAAVAERSVARIRDQLAEYPHLAEVVGGHVAKVGYDFDAEFEFGLDLILESLERLLVSRSP